jgi:hypothetical protein
MFEKKYEERLVLWGEFRKHLEDSKDPIQDTIEFFSTVPILMIDRCGRLRGN